MSKLIRTIKKKSTHYYIAFFYSYLGEQFNHNCKKWLDYRGKTVNTENLAEDVISSWTTMIFSIYFNKHWYKITCGKV